MALDRVIRKQQAREESVIRSSLESAKDQISTRIHERLASDQSLKGLEKEDAYRVASDLAWSFLEDELDRNFPHAAFSAEQKRQLIEGLLQNMFGLGVLEPYLKDPAVTEIMVNGVDRIFIERDHKLVRLTDSAGTPVTFPSEKELLRVIQRIVAPLNRKVDESDPLVDARIPQNGSRVSVALPPVALDGPTITIRKFPQSPYTMDDLVKFGTLPEPVAELLASMVQARYNLVISGGTGSGKTTFLNALSMFIPANQRLVTIEDAAELKLAKAENIVRLETRPPNVEGKGAITMRDLVKASLRMRPDRIIVGEVRGGEALDMLQAMNTGHDGSLTTGHANSAADILSRIETMVLSAGVDLPLRAIRAQIVAAVDFIIHVAKLRDTNRRMVQLTEVLDLDGDRYVTQDLLLLKRDVGGEYKLLPTGKRIRKSEKFEAAGMEVPDGDFGLGP